MISTHILDTSKGQPASGISVKLQKQEAGQWKDVETGVSNADGRHLFSAEAGLGTYKILFQVESYLKKSSAESFYSEIPVIFKIENAQRKYHVPLLLNPFGYSTYRGS